MIGAGAIGTTMALLLADRARVIVAVRAAESAAALESSGFEATGAFARRAGLSVCRLDVAPIEEDTFVLVTSRAQHMRSALATVAPRLSPRTPVVLAMEGLGVLDDARAALPDHVAWIRSACWMDAREEGQGKVRIVDLRSIALAATGGALASVRALEEKLIAAGVLTSVEFDARALEWQRTLPSIAIGALCAVVGREDGAILDEPELRTIAESALEEALRVAAADGVQLGPSDSRRVFSALEGARQRVGTVLEDLRAGRVTEVAFLSGGVSRAGRRLGIPTPVHDMLGSLATYLERKASAAFGSRDESLPATLSPR